MSKKNKKQIKKPVSIEMMVQKAGEAFAAGKYRKAKDLYKDLCKHDRNKYLPLLINSYEELAKELMKKGQTTEAKTVIDYVKTLDPDKSFSSIETQINIKKSNDSATTVDNFVQFIIDDFGNMDKEEVLKASDLLVTSFKDFPLLMEKRPDIHADLTAITNALTFICDSKYDETLESIRSLKIKSIFAHWKLFLKGMVAFYTKDDDKATVYLKKLPEKSITYKASKGFLLLMDKSHRLDKAEMDYFAKNGSIPLDIPSHYTEIMRADYLWRKGRHRDSFKHISAKFDDFPTEGRGLASDLTRFYYNAPLHMEEDAGEKLVKELVIRDYSKSDREGTINLLLSRLFTIQAETFNDVLNEAVGNAWSMFIDAYEKEHNKNKKVNALIYLRLGCFFSEKSKVSKGFMPPFLWDSKYDETDESELAIKYLKESAIFNKTDKKAYIELLHVYENIKDKKNINKLLDNIIKLFPEDKEILLKTGVACIERKVYVKGIRYLENASKLDPLDRTVKENLVYGHMQLARSYLKKDKINQCRDTLKKSLEYGSASSIDISTGHAYIYVQRAALEYALNNDEIGAEMMQKAFSLNVPELALLFYSPIIFQEFDLQRALIDSFEKDFNDKTKSNLNAETVLHLLKILNWFASSGANVHLHYQKRKLLSFAIKAAKNKKDICSRETVKEIVKTVLSEEDEYSFEMDSKLVKLYIKKMLSYDKMDPLFRFYSYLLDKNSGYSRFGRFTYKKLDKLLKELNSILTVAEERHETTLMNDVKREIDRLEMHYDDDEHYDDDDEDEHYYDDDIDSAVGDVLNNMDDKQINEMIETILPGLKNGEIPGDFPFPVPPGKPMPRKNKGKPNKGEQLDFFNLLDL